MSRFFLFTIIRGFCHWMDADFFPPIRTGKTTAIVDGRLNVCGEGELTFVEMTVGHNLRT